MENFDLSSIRVSREEMLEKLTNQDLEYFERIRLKLIERIYSVADAAISGRVLSHWIKQRLLPYTFDEKGWRKFNFIEFIWIKVIQELRRLGISIQEIEKLKNEMFRFNFKKFFELVDNSDSKYLGDPNFKSVIEKGKEWVEENTEEEIQKYQPSYFMTILWSVLAFDHNLCIVTLGDGDFKVVVLGDYFLDLKNENDEILQSITKESFVLINLRKIVYDILKSDNLDINWEYTLGFISEKERRLLTYVQKGGLKEILITFNDSDDITHLKLKKNKISNETLNKVARYLMKGNFKDIQFKTKDGHLVSYEETDIIKL